MLSSHNKLTLGIMEVFPYLNIPIRTRFSAYGTDCDPSVGKIISRYVKQEVNSGTFNDAETRRDEYRQQVEASSEKIENIRSRIEQLEQDLKDTKNQLVIEKHANNIYRGLENATTRRIKKWQDTINQEEQQQVNDAYAQRCRQFLQNVPQQTVINLSLEVVELYNQIHITNDPRFSFIPRGFFINNPTVSDSQAVAFAHLLKIVKFFEDNWENEYKSEEFIRFEFYASVQLPENYTTSYFVVSNEVETDNAIERCVIPVNYDTVCSYPKNEYCFNLDTNLEIIIDY